MGCGTTRSKLTLRRLALVGGRVVAEGDARLPGRGAYVCGPKCLELAVARRAFARAFRRPVTVAPSVGDLVESIRT